MRDRVANERCSRVEIEPGSRCAVYVHLSTRILRARSSSSWLRKAVEAETAEDRPRRRK